MSRGFTILEVMIVLVIIGLIMGFVGPQLFRQLDKSKVQAAETQIKLLRASLSAFYLDMQRYPTTAEGLQALKTAPSSADARQWSGPYVQDDVPVDPWGKPYVYQLGPNREKPYFIFSYGADSKPGGEGIDRDIGLLPPTSSDATN